MARKNHGIEMLHSKRRCHEEEKQGVHVGSWEGGSNVCHVKWVVVSDCRLGDGC